MNARVPDTGHGPATLIDLGDGRGPVDGSLAPKDRTFRGAWTMTGKVITIDMEKARAIQRDTIRAARTPLLEQLDTAWFRASETGNEADKADIVARKNALRNATKDERIDAAKTPEELAALTLETLLA